MQFHSIKEFTSLGKTRQIRIMAGSKNKHGLTPKQQKFAENLANGMTQTDAYKNAFDAEGMKNATIRSKACILAARPNIRAALDALVEERVRIVEARGLGDRDEVVSLLKRFATDEDRPDHVRLRAVELWGKTCGAFVEVVEDRRGRSAATVATELERRLSALLAAAAPQVTVIEHAPLQDDADDDGAA